MSIAPSEHHCLACNVQSSEGGVTLLRCSICKNAYYCSPECQKTNWKVHKRSCTPADPDGSSGITPAASSSSPSSSTSPTGAENPWYHRIRRKTLQDGGRHDGQLELITWNTTDEDGDKLGWGGVFIDESDDLKRRFETEMNRDLLKLYNYWPAAFRWTCCGQQADVDHGCDHHGRAGTPCKCDFCRMGKPLPLKIFKSNQKSPGGVGLELPRGPDKRSFDPAQAALAVMGRQILGMDS